MPADRMCKDELHLVDFECKHIVAVQGKRAFESASVYTYLQQREGAFHNVPQAAPSLSLGSQAQYTLP